MEPHKKYIYLEPFIQASFKIIKAVTGIKITGTNVKIIHDKQSSGGVGIILSINGDLEGKVVYELSRDMTMKLAYRMIERNNIQVESSTKMKKLLNSAIHELGNLIAGKAITLLSEIGYNCSITPPIGYVGKGYDLFSKDNTTFVIELTTQMGLFVINISISNVKGKRINM